MIFKRLSRELKLQVSPHKIRRTFAIMMLRNGADVYRLKEMMGHADIRTLEQYLAINEESIFDIHILAAHVSSLTFLNVRDGSQ
jgi:site-specific recombinase XerD